LPLALGWGMPEVGPRGETVVAAFAPDRLSEGLTQLHGHGFGSSARVLDGARGDLGGQLARLGLPPETLGRLIGNETDTDIAIVVVMAAARSAPVAELLNGAGATAVDVIWPTVGETAESVESVVGLPGDVSVAELGA
jgi:hypothetical protein